jgi:exosortase
MIPALIFALAFGVFAISAANVHFVFGAAGLRYFAFPILFLMIALPPPSVLNNLIIGGLQSKVATLNVEILNSLGVPAHRVGSLIHLSTGIIGIDEACSGIRSLQSTIMATLFIGYVSLKHRGLQVALLAFGVLLAFVGNVIRSLYLCLTASREGMQVAERVHDRAGWSILVFTAVGVILLSWAFSKLEISLGKQKGSRLPRPDEVKA